MDFKVVGDRTIVSFEERDVFRIEGYDFNGLERDLQRKDLSSQSRQAIEHKMGRNALQFLRETGSDFGMTEALDKTENKRIQYLGLKKGINIESNVGGGWKESKGDVYFSFPSQINMQAGEDGKSVSIQWAFEGGIERIPLTYLLRIHSVITGRYQLAQGIAHPSKPVLIVNPVNEFPRFMEGLEQSYKLLKQSGVGEELAGLRDKLTGDLTIDSAVTGMYAKKFLEVLDIKIE